MWLLWPFYKDIGFPQLSALKTGHLWIFLHDENSNSRCLFKNSQVSAGPGPSPLPPSFCRRRRCRPGDERLASSPAPNFYGSVSQAFIFQQLASIKNRYHLRVRLVLPLPRLPSTLPLHRIYCNEAKTQLALKSTCR